MIARTERRLTLGAALALSAGALVYPLARGDGAPLAGIATANQLPALLHACAFVLASLAVTAPWPRLALPVCAFWVGLVSLFELVQIDAVRASLDGGSALLDAHVDGVFDPLDMVAGALGAVLALASAHSLQRHDS